MRNIRLHRARKCDKYAKELPKYSVKFYEETFGKVYQWIHYCQGIAKKLYEILSLTEEHPE